VSASPHRGPGAPPPGRQAPAGAIADGATVREWVAWLRSASARLWRFVREIAGENDYLHYLERQRRHDPDAAVMSEREFWRHRSDAADHRPGARCC